MDIYMEKEGKRPVRSYNQIEEIECDRDVDMRIFYNNAPVVLKIPWADQFL